MTDPPPDLNPREQQNHISQIPLSVVRKRHKVALGGGIADLARQPKGRLVDGTPQLAVRDVAEAEAEVVVVPGDGGVDLVRLSLGIVLDEGGD